MTGRFSWRHWRWYRPMRLDTDCHLLGHGGGHSPLLSLCLFQSKFCKEPSRHHHHNLNNRKLSTFCTQYKVFMRYFQVVQEYERAVIFRLGRLLSGGSKGPGRSGVLCLMTWVRVGYWRLCSNVSKSEGFSVDKCPILIAINTIVFGPRRVIFAHRRDLTHKLACCVPLFCQYKPSSITGKKIDLSKIRSVDDNCSDDK